MLHLMLAPNFGDKDAMDETARTLRLALGSLRLRVWIGVGALLFWGAAAVSAQTGGFFRIDIPATGSYATWYVPTSADPNQPLPLVVFLHGSGGRPESYHRYVQPAAEAIGCALLLPKSLDSRGWGFGPDDLTLREALRQVRDLFRVDEQRVSIAGHSSGGAYAFQRAYLELTRYSAVFSLASPFTAIPTVADPDYKAPLRMYYGDQDPNYTTSYPRLRTQWQALGIPFEEEIQPGLGHSQLPAASLLAGFRFLVAKRYPTRTPESCITGQRAAATLLVPFFEVDLEHPSGPTTLFAVNNALTEPALARVVLWTDCGLPVLGFDLYLGPDEVRTINLRDVLAGQLPVSTPPADAPSFPGCTRPLTLPGLDSAARERLKRQLVGLPDPQSGLCSASPQAPRNRATGWVTIDATQRCAETALYPGDPGYFAVGDQGLASQRNALWGDVFYVDSGQNNAQGFEAIAVPAAPERFVRGDIPSFYRLGVDERLPLSSRFRTRYLNGGPFAGGTHLIVWLGGRSDQPFPCGQACPGSADHALLFTVRNEAATQTSSFALNPGRFAMKLEVGSSDLPVSEPFGSLSLDHVEYPPTPGTPPWRRQAAVLPIYTAAGRFSIGLSAVRLDDSCIVPADPPPP